MPIIMEPCPDERSVWLRDRPIFPDAVEFVDELELYAKYILYFCGFGSFISGGNIHGQCIIEISSLPIGKKLKVKMLPKERVKRVTLQDLGFLSRNGYWNHYQRLERYKP